MDTISFSIFPGNRTLGAQVAMKENIEIVGVTEVPDVLPW